MGTSERQVFRARFAWLCKWLLSDVCGGGLFTVKVVCLPAPLLDGCRATSQTPPVSSFAMLHCCCCS